ncbi:MAG: hypothetical protein KC925_03850, partial [Candidatus Doudnabacteria bacterium]|nr:hypothetical protein [Candidatus Doudnabacteria bacterium]
RQTALLLLAIVALLAIIVGSSVVSFDNDELGKMGNRVEDIGKGNFGGKTAEEARDRDEELRERYGK